MVSSLDMALSDIIKSKKTNKVGKKSSAGIKKRGSFKRNSVGNSKKNASTPRRQSGGIRKPARQASVVTPNDKRTVRINISNLAPTVVSDDLRELFGEFKIRSVNVNFNEKGTPLGTGDVTLSRFHADRLIQKFSGVSLDGHQLKFAVIDSNIASRTIFPTAQKTPTRRDSAGKNRGFKPKRGSAKTTKKSEVAKKSKREEKPKKTTEELDAELAAYMARRGV